MHSKVKLGDKVRVVYEGSVADMHEDRVNLYGFGWVDLTSAEVQVIHRRKYMVGQFVDNESARYLPIGSVVEDQRSEHYVMTAGRGWVLCESESGASVATSMMPMAAIVYLPS